MNFERARGGVLKLGPDALATMRSFEQHAPDSSEAGGLLMGRHLRDGDNVVVDLMTTPMPGDERSRFGFFRSAESHQRILDAAWEESGGTCLFLGDWHTHAEPDPTPSAVDLDNWRAMLLENVELDPACFFLIVGQQKIRAWEGNRSTGEIAAMRCGDGVPAPAVWSLAKE